MSNRITKKLFCQYDVISSRFFRFLLNIISVIIVKYLQKRYKSISIKNHGHSNQTLSKLKLMQSILYYFKCQFSAWGYFHPSCVWSEKDEKYFKKLFPQKDFKEIDLVVWHNPNAVTYYQNKIWELSKQCPPIYEKEIKKQLIKWGDWN